MTKKLAIIGKGTTGSLANLWFRQNFVGEIDWYYDPNIPPMSVGEGTQLGVPTMLWDTVEFTFYDDLPTLNGTIKTGIRKVNWGGVNDFQHPFPPPQVAMHFDAGLMQKYVIEKMTNDRKINLIEKNVKPEEVDADYVLDCSGLPKDLSGYHTETRIPVNAVHVTQCWWDNPTFDYTFMIARPHGWVFGIPLKHRCSVGYLYNHNISSLEEVKDDVKEVFEFIGVNPSETTNSFHFNNYWKKEPYSDRIGTSGNAAFFLEPLEATSFTTSIQTFHGSHSVWRAPHQKKHHNDAFNTYMQLTEQMIMMHYFAGSAFDSKFWTFAKKQAHLSMLEAIKEPFYRETFFHLNDQDYDIYRDPNIPVKLRQLYESITPGGWSYDSFRFNSHKLGINDKLINLVKGIL